MSDVPGLGMETGLSNLAFPRLNLSSMRSWESVDVELRGGEQILMMCQKAVRHTDIGIASNYKGRAVEEDCKLTRSER